LPAHGSALQLDALYEIAMECELFGGRILMVQAYERLRHNHEQRAPLLSYTAVQIESVLSADDGARRQRDSGLRQV
jgi:hypothetical protein